MPSSSRTLGLLGCGCLIFALACDGSASDAPRAPGGSSGAMRGPTTVPDDGDDPDPAADAAAPDAVDAGAEEDVLPNECVTIEAADFVGEDQPVGGGFFTGVSLPDDFSVTRIQSAWAPGCDEPSYRITLSEGRCPDGRGQELVFWLDAEAVESGLIRMGQNPILEEPGTQGIRIRYRRPEGLDPAGEWGSCELVVGNLDLLGDVNLDPRTELQGRFQLDLTACDEATAGVQIVQGTFNALVRRSRAEVCPP